MSLSSHCYFYAYKYVIYINIIVRWIIVYLNLIVHWLVVYCANEIESDKRSDNILFMKYRKWQTIRQHGNMATFSRWTYGRYPCQLGNRHLKRRNPSSKETQVSAKCYAAMLSLSTSYFVLEKTLIISTSE